MGLDPRHDRLEADVARGSGDPFLIVDEQTVRFMPDWRVLIDEQTNRATANPWADTNDNGSRVGAQEPSGEDSHSHTRIIAPPR